MHKLLLTTIVATALSTQAMAMDFCPPPSGEDKSQLLVESNIDSKEVLAMFDKINLGWMQNKSGQTCQAVIWFHQEYQRASLVAYKANDNNIYMFRGNERLNFGLLFPLSAP
jgi:hypothetical protein